MRNPQRFSSYTQIRRNSNGTPSKEPGTPPEPLRILFCGSDDFSCASLKALHKLHKERPDVIESIDVVTRKGKPVGRGLKLVAVGPVFNLANKLKLPLHEIGTFTGWDLPLPGHITHPITGALKQHSTAASLCGRPSLPFNLLTAVSFGLFVPPRILKALKYGGLNIHPSLLPDLRGPAPIPYAILAQRPVTGVTLQTLHAKTFDHGAILAQTPTPPGIPIPDNATTPSLLATLAPAGADLLIQGLLDGVHVRNEIIPPTAALADVDILSAPKITKVDMAIDWGNQYRPHESLSAAGLERRFRAFGVGRGLWAYAYTAPPNSRESRVFFEDVEAVRCPPLLREAVRAVLQARAAAAVGDDGASKGSAEPAADVAGVTFEVGSRKLGNVVFGGQSDMTGPAREFRLPVHAEAESGKALTNVIIPVRVPYKVVDGTVVMTTDKEYDAIRVRKIKAEGSGSKEATKALKPFWERNVIGRDLVGMDYAVDVMARRIEG